MNDPVTVAIILILACISFAMGIALWVARSLVERSLRRAGMSPRGTSAAITVGSTALWVFGILAAVLYVALK
jgi:hypothetical protein